VLPDTFADMEEYTRAHIPLMLHEAQAQAKYTHSTVRGTSWPVLVKGVEMVGDVIAVHLHVTRTRAAPVRLLGSNPAPLRAGDTASTPASLCRSETCWNYNKVDTGQPQW
jgi:hypothetical protein